MKCPKCNLTDQVAFHSNSDYVTKYNCNRCCINWSDFGSPERSETILEEAGRVVSGDRCNAYGHPLDSFRVIALRWNAYLQSLAIAQHGDETILPELSYRHVAHIMTDFKVSRDIFKSKRDNLVDLCGYAFCAELAQNEEKRRASIISVSGEESEVKCQTQSGSCGSSTSTAQNETNAHSAQQ